MPTNQTPLLKYNGFDFGDPSHVTISEEPIYDEAKRSAQFVKITISVSAIIGGDATLTTDFDMQDIRYKLMQNGKKLEFRGRGAGNDLIIDNKNDMMFGPQVGILNWNPVGLHACEIRWECVVHVPECSPTNFVKPVTNGVLSRNYSFSYQYDSRGDLTRTLQGYLLIAMNWDDKYRLNDSIERYRKAIMPRRLNGFKRTHQFTPNPAKNRIDFSIVDTQYPSPTPYPSFAVNMSGSQTSSWRLNHEGARRFQIDVDMTFEPYRDRVNQQLMQYDAIKRFHKFLTARRLAAKANTPKNSNNPGAGEWFLTSLSFTEEFYNFPVRCRASFYVLGTGVDDIFRSTGLFLRGSGTGPPGDESSEQWGNHRNEASRHAGNTRGNFTVENVLEDPSSDDRIGLCGKSPDPSPITTGTPVYPPGNPQGAQLGFSNAVPEPDGSYIDFEIRSAIRSDRPVSAQHVLQSPDKVSGVPSLAAAVGAGFGKAAGKAAIHQNSGRSRQIVTIVGRGWRAGHPVPKYLVDKIGKVDLVELHYDHIIRPTAKMFGVQTQMAFFRGVYSAVNSIGNLAVPEQLEDGQPGHTPK